ncbi:PilZ domain-containing protein [Thiocapsa imhoffii]|nr:PilZ domain-containing protein [Thiocapsa imhoffii]
MTNQSADPSPQPTPPRINRRTQCRVGAQIPIEVQLPGVDHAITAMNQDISWGGAQFIAALPVSTLPKRVRLVFPWRAQEKITVMAEIVRAQRLEGGRYQVAVRFEMLSARSQARLEKLLRMLRAATPDTDDDADCMVRELELAIDDVGSLRDILEQIATGHLIVTVFDAFAVGQSIRLSVRRTEDMPGLRLRARVREVETLAMPALERAQLYRLSLSFEHPPAAIKEFVDTLIEQLPPVWDDAQSQFADAPDWLRAIHLARVVEAGVRVADPDEVCVLEARFPRALNELQVVWGDPESFDLRFRDLTLGDSAEPGGWPDEAWDELGFLQDVHDLAYGLPHGRESPLRPTRCR